MANPKIRRMVSAAYTIDNSNDDDRIYNIEAEVEIKDNQVTHITGGTVTDRQNQQLADFDRYSNLRSNIYPETGVVEIFTAIQTFIENTINGIDTILAEK